ncbi:LytR/AlgR family response regulator transcription factor [Pedobacter metabolipauper]|uniref:LytTR family two component transcriptional regulator n=1 Tax=Pedobacter metabolipauper TaxID=425513 RepID=A0A4R6SU99_9SPHI|nr:LytTR family DNA-binding domain-containing protein [Pedobacter metabolipauper]TDQ09348.1 LytTR family two component transcriptional regulator [Pedobacter metabolipauper]
MNVILVDDEPSNIENLQALLNRHCRQVHILATALDIASAAKLANMHQPDLIFLDIQMGPESGFDLLKLLPNKSFEVIFVTAYDQYGIQAVKFAALDYLLKPVDIDELISSVNKAAIKLKEKTQNKQLDFLLSLVRKDEKNPVKIALPQLQEIRYVQINDIIRCEASNTYTSFFLINRETIVVSRSLKEYADMLQPQGFIRSHQSHLVNPAFVKSWLKEDGGILLLTDGYKIPVSKPNRERVKNLLNK